MKMKTTLLSCALVGMASVASVMPASADTITVLTDPVQLDQVYELNVDDFKANRGPGSGQSVSGDPREVNLRDLNDDNLFGRYPVFGDSWVDSNDNGKVTWDVSLDNPTKEFTFSVTDAHDQSDSFFNVRFGNQKLEFGREGDGNLKSFLIAFDNPTDKFKIRFFTEKNDGFGVTGASYGALTGPQNPAPVPLPAGGLLLLAGLGAFAGVRRLRK